MTIKEFIKANRFRMVCEWIAERPDATEKDDWQRTATHWRCDIKRGRAQMRIYFSQGSAHTGEPSLETVLDCLGSGFASVLNARTFEEWADDLGYSRDSRKAESTYNTIARQLDRFERLSGDDGGALARALAFEVERL